LIPTAKVVMQADDNKSARAAAGNPR
jgi:hypothetical protein